jgi:DNA-binding PucR family transcriptional regulator
MTAAVIQAVPEYASFASPEGKQVVYEHSLDHVHAVVRTIRAWHLPTPEELGFVRERGALRATQQLPLSALLHSYRLGHRTVWEHLVRLLSGSDRILEASLALTDLTLGYTELISSALADGYTERQRHLLLQGDRDRRDLLERILQGTVERQSETARLASTFAMVHGGDYLVVVMHAGPTAASPTGEPLTRAAETLTRHFALGIAQPFVVVRHAEIVSIAPLSRARASAITHLTRQSRAELEQHGEPWYAGISTVCAGLGEVARGYQEARLAADLAAERGGVCALIDLPVSDYLLDRADDTAQRIIPLAGRQVLASPHAHNRLLIETLEAYVRAELSVAATADALAVHPNTISYRLRKLGQRLGRDLTRFSDVVEVMSWIRVMQRARPTD